MAKKWAELSTSEKWQGGCSLIVIVLVAVLVVSISTTGDSLPKTIKDIGSEVSRVDSANGFLNIDVALPDQVGGQYAIYNASSLVLKAVKIMQAGGGGMKLADVQGATFTFSVPTQSRLGEDGRADLINIILSGDQVRRARPDKMSAFDVVDVAKIELPSAVAAEAARDYCASEAKLSPRFCGGLFAE